MLLLLILPYEVNLTSGCRNLAFSKRKKAPMKITEKYRPRNLSDVAAQTTAVRQIENAINQSGLAGSSWWITGATGTGKTTIARILAETFTENEFTIYEFVGRNVTVEDIREYQTHMSFFPMGKGRCLIINEAQDMSDSVVSLLLALVEKINESKHDMVVFTAMVDVLELKNDPMNRWRALVGRCSPLDLADTDSPVFRQEVVEYLEGVAALEGILGADVPALCKKAKWSIRAALNALDMQGAAVQPVSDEQKVQEPKLAHSEPAATVVSTARAASPLNVEFLENGYAVKNRATRFVIRSIGNRWCVDITNHMTKASARGGRRQKFYGSLAEIESAYKCLKGIAEVHSSQLH
jgi:replication-associated recombination protein RarA